ncbi:MULTISPECIES: ImcF-related family protein [Pseudomonas]|uniref:ImcF-related family protein n=1 Tax=Pseudomonas TaxID=286 RepID=UPI001E6194E0|nr:MULTISPECIES: ImcF-related family protein [Pseudomonas]MCD4528546.1 type VI secretion protein VasK [Pseudomonas sp. C3-2018]
MRTLNNSWRRAGAAVWSIMLTAMLGWIVWTYGERAGLLEPAHKLLASLLVMTMAMLGYLIPRLLIHLKRQDYREQGLVNKVHPQPDAELVLRSVDVQLAELRNHLRHQHGLFWRRKIRILLVVGGPEPITAIAPDLAEKHWLEGQDTVLLWGGSVQAELNAPLLTEWLKHSRGRALDGVVWALDKTQCTDDQAMSVGLWHLQALARKVGWELPLHLWQVCASAWSQDGRQTQPVGCVLPARMTPESLESCLEALRAPLRREGLEQMQVQMQHDFLLRLSRDLRDEGIARWRRALAPLWSGFARGVPLRGLWFSLPLRREAPGAEHLWLPDPAWHGVRGDRSVTARLGWSAPRCVQALVLGLALVWGTGMGLSFISNRAQVIQVNTLLTALQQSSRPDEQLLALHELVRELARLDYRIVHGAPWYQRFGLNRNEVVRDAVWPRYVEANNRLIRDPAAAQLRAQLDALVKLPPNSSERAERAREAYAQLKAYLMMAHPEKADADYLVQTLGKTDTRRDGISPGLWQLLAPNLWQFYGEQLAAHPQWRIEADPRWVAQVRQVLLGQLGQRNAEASLYQQVLDEAAHHYPALGLQQMVGDTEAAALFSSKASVPGVFTRQAWEGRVRQAIDDIAQARREEIDWVLSDRPDDVDAQLSPELLKQRLTERYFQDYASAWLVFLNSLRTRQPRSLSEVIDQLTLMSDVRQSPLIALVNTLAYQGQAGTRGQALADSLMKSAQKLMGPDKAPVIDQLADLPGSPLDATFGPLLALLGKGAEGKHGGDELSLQAFLTRVTRVRLKLQQISTAADPLEMTQALAQTVFQGRGIDLSESQAYARLMAASLGAQWAGVGDTLFVQPLEQAWQRVLQPSAAGLNSQWQRSIVNHWDAAFSGRYPFAATSSDASLPMLGQMIRADSGRIERFLHEQLSGVLRKEGNRWVADPRHGQGLRINPQFLTAVNHLSELADVLYTDGGLGLSFELRGKPRPDVVDSTFTLNGEKHHYFNQRERWQRFNWPGRSEYPGARLTWTGLVGNEQLFGDYAGTWGLIRLLEIAQLTPLDDRGSHYRMLIKAPDGANMIWHLRTELDAGPLALLKLRGFRLPQQIFLAAGGANARNEVFE